MDLLNSLLSRAFVHSTAQVANSAEIGDGTKVWNDCQIREGARIGKGCVLGKGVYVDAGVVIGDHVKIQNGVSIYQGVAIEDGVFIGPHVCFTNDKYPRAVNPDMTPRSAKDWEIRPTLVREGASIGANATIVCGVTIGRWAMVAAGAVVTKKVPDHILVAGNPAIWRTYVCACGLPMDKETVQKGRALRCRCGLTVEPCFA